MSLYYDSITMEYANVSVRFPEELDREVERFLAETGIYTNKSEFIKDSVRRRLAELHSDPAIAALLTAGGDTAESWTVQRMIIFYHWRSTVEQ